MTRTTGLALGAVAAALLATDSRLVDMAPVLAALLAASAVGLRVLERRPAAQATAAVALGLSVVLARVALGGGAAAQPAGPVVLPLGDGPWTVRVAALAAPRDGSQRFVGGLDDGSDSGSTSRPPAIPRCEPGTASRSGAPCARRPTTVTVPTLRGPASRRRSPRARSGRLRPLPMPTGSCRASGPTRETRWRRRCPNRPPAWQQAS